MGLPLTPSPFVTVTPDPAVIVRCAQVSVAVLAASPVPARPSRADRSFAKASVGFPLTPLPFVIVIPAAGAERLRATGVFAAVRDSRPVLRTDTSVPNPPFASLTGSDREDGRELSFC